MDSLKLINVRNRINIDRIHWSAIFAFLMLFAACSEPEQVDPQEFDKSITSLAVDKNNTKWIGTEEGLYYSTGSSYQKETGSLGVSTLLYEPNTNLLWSGTQIGLRVLMLNGTEIESVALIPEENTSNPTILSSYLDNSFNRWFGSAIGLTYNSSDSWKNDSFRINTLGKIFPMKIEQLAINSIAEWDGDYFFATSGGSIYRATGLVDSVDAFTGATQWISPYNGQNLTDTMFVVFVDSKGNQWMGGKNGIQVHEGHDPKNQADFTFYNDELVNNRIHVIAEAPDGDIWVGTEGGISVFDGTNWLSIITDLPDLNITSIAFDKLDGSAWIGTKKGLVNIK